MERPGPFGDIVFQDVDRLIVHRHMDPSTFDKLTQTHRAARERWIGDPVTFYYNQSTSDINYTLILSQTSLIGRWLRWSQPGGPGWRLWVWRIQCQWLCQWARLVATCLRTLWLVGIGTWITLLPLLCWCGLPWAHSSFQRALLLVAFTVLTHLARIVRDAVERQLASHIEPVQEDASVWDKRQHVASSRLTLRQRAAAWFVGNDDSLQLPPERVSGEEIRAVSVILSLILDTVAMFIVYMWIVHGMLEIYFSISPLYLAGLFLLACSVVLFATFLYAWNWILTRWGRHTEDFRRRAALAASQDPDYTEAIWWARQQIHPEIAIVRPFVPWTLASPIRHLHSFVASLLIMAVGVLLPCGVGIVWMDELIYVHVVKALMAMMSASMMLHAIRFHIVPFWKWSWASTARRQRRPIA